MDRRPTTASILPATCGRSFEALTPQQFFVQQSARLVPGVRGIGNRAGANPAALIARSQAARSPRGPIAAVAQCRATTAVSRRCSTAWAKQMQGCRSTCRSSDSSLTQQRLVLHGTGDEWIKSGGGKKGEIGKFRFSTRGSIPRWKKPRALSQRYRNGWEHLVGEVDCSVCGGSRLRDDASAVSAARPHDPSALPLPLAESGRRCRLVAICDARQQKIAGELVQRGDQPAAVSGRRRPRISVAVPPAADAVRRRSAADSAGQPGRQRTVRRALCPRRTDDRPAPARQRSLARSLAASCATWATRC